MKKVLSLIVLFAFIVIGCKKQTLGEPIVLNGNNTPGGSVNITKAEAEKLAFDAVGWLDDATTKSVARKVKANEVICNAATRSGASSDTLFYVVNFEDDSGFAVIAADSRTPQVLAISDNGNFDWQQAENSERSFLTKSMTSYQMSRIGGPSGDIMTDVGSGTVVVPGVVTEYDFGPWEQSYKLAPMLKTIWTQGSPCNRYIRDGYVSGCVALAAAQVMAYFQYPESHDGFIFNWNEIGNKSSETTAYFIKMAFDHIPGQFYTFLDKNSVGNDPYNIRFLLADLGYASYGDFIQHYDYNMIVNSLKGGSPVCLGGYVDKSLLSNGHSWVADGYLINERLVRPYSYYIKSGGKFYHPEKNFYQQQKFLHYNWGWGGYLNGYFYEGLFDAKKGSYDPGQWLDNKDANKDLDFHGLNTMWINIKRP